MVRLQWDLQGEKEKLVRVLSAERVDEKESAASAARVMERENKVKASHLAMLVRIKNHLTPAQQKKLRSLRGDASDASAKRHAGRQGDRRVMRRASQPACHARSPTKESDLRDGLRPRSDSDRARSGSISRRVPLQPDQDPSVISSRNWPDPVGLATVLKVIPFRALAAPVASR